MHMREKTYIVLKRNMNVKGDSVEDSEGSEIMIEKASVVLENTYISMNSMLVETRN